MLLQAFENKVRALVAPFDPAPRHNLNTKDNK